MLFGTKISFAIWLWTARLNLVELFCARRTWPPIIKKSTLSIFAYVGVALLYLGGDGYVSLTSLFGIVVWLLVVAPTLHLIVDDVAS